MRAEFRIFRGDRRTCHVGIDRRQRAPRLRDAPPSCQIAEHRQRDGWRHEAIGKHPPTAPTGRQKEKRRARRASQCGRGANANVLRGAFPANRQGARAKLGGDDELARSIPCCAVVVVFGNRSARRRSRILSGTARAVHAAVHRRSRQAGRGAGRARLGAVARRWRPYRQAGRRGRTGPLRGHRTCRGAGRLEELRTRHHDRRDGLANADIRNRRRGARGQTGARQARWPSRGEGDRHAARRDGAAIEPRRDVHRSAASAVRSCARHPVCADAANRGGGER